MLELNLRAALRAARVGYETEETPKGLLVVAQTPRGRLLVRLVPKGTTEQNRRAIARLVGETLAG